MTAVMYCWVGVKSVHMWKPLQCTYQGRKLHTVGYTVDAWQVHYEKWGKVNAQINGGGYMENIDIRRRTAAQCMPRRRFKIYYSLKCGYLLTHRHIHTRADRATLIMQPMERLCPAAQKRISQSIASQKRVVYLATHVLMFSCKKNTNHSFLRCVPDKYMSKYEAKKNETVVLEEGQIGLHHSCQLKT